MAVGAISASRQPPPSPTPTPKTVTTPIEPKLPLTTKSSQTTKPPQKKCKEIEIKGDRFAFFSTLVQENQKEAMAI
jgi:hypothetical protein